VDSENSYHLQGDIYVGQQPGENPAESRERNKPSNFAKQLARHYEGLGFSISADNLWGEYQLATDFILVNIGVVTTVRQNKPFNPRQMLPNRYVRFGFEN
jgi:hypothetical protein